MNHKGPKSGRFFELSNWIDFNIVDGGEGNDVITMGSGPDSVYGRGGNDFINLGAGNNIAFAGSGNDTILVIGLAHVYNISGSLSQPRTYYYAPSSNAIWAGDGDDSVTISNIYRMSELAAALNGEGGNDTISIKAAGPSWVTGGDGNDRVTLTSVVDWFSGYGIVYHQSNDTVWGDAGNDVISTDGGNDTVVGGTGHDWIFGGFGNDHLYGARAAASATGKRTASR